MLILGLVDLPWWAILIILGVLWYLYETRHFGYFSKQGVPFLEPKFMMGSALHYDKRGVPYSDPQFYNRFRNKGYYGEFVSCNPTLIVFDEEFLSDLLVKESANFNNHIVFGAPGTLLGDKMLVNMKDALWKNTRNEMSPAFSTGKMKLMNNDINRCAKSFTEYILKKVEANETFNAREHAGAFSMDAICATAFGMQVDTMSEKDSEFLKHAKGFFNFSNANFKFIFPFFFPVIAKWLPKLGINFDPFSKDSQNFFRQVANQLMDMRKVNDKSRADFFQIMMNAKNGVDIRDDGDKSAPAKGLTKDEILANAIGFLGGGYDTTANALAFLMHALATEPDVQEKLIEEIDSVVKSKDEVDYKLLMEMPYLDQCIQETFRMYPPATRLNRICGRDITMHGVYIKKGMMVQVPVLAIHHDPYKWPEPEKFKPERFSSENKKDRSTYHYLPFGAGPRMCLGMRLALQEMKVAVVLLLKYVKLERCAETQVPVQFDASALLQSSNIIIKATER